MKVTDPVCGMEINADAAHAVEAFEGLHYHFCSAQCRQIFMRDPMRYANPSPGEHEQVSGPHHGGRSGRGCCG